jgi:hypothetical protein
MSRHVDRIVQSRNAQALTQDLLIRQARDGNL